jgi:serine/threonine-protein kinase
MDSAPPGQPFGRYRLLSLIGKGGMGEIYLALGPGVAGVEKRLAIKKLLPTLAEDEGFVARFLDEARLVVTLSHGNIVPVFEAGRVGRDYFLAMEYVEGCNLREIGETLLEAKRLLPIPLALFIAHEVSRGLDYAHRKTDVEGRPLGIIHRDVSPQNVLVAFDGEVRLVDFGIAKAAGKSQRTFTGALMGKFAYMSPEQAMGLPLDGRSDQFALGVVLHELLTGQPLFDGETDPEVLRKVQETRVAAPSSIRAEVSPELDALVLRTLARDPVSRFADMGELTKALGKLLYNGPQAAGAADLAAFLSPLFPDRATRVQRGLDLLAQGPAALPAVRGQTASMQADGEPLAKTVVSRRWSSSWTTVAVALPALALGYALRNAPSSVRAETSPSHESKLDVPSQPTPTLTSSPTSPTSPQTPSNSTSSASTAAVLRPIAPSSPSNSTPELNPGPRPNPSTAPTGVSTVATAPLETMHTPSQPAPIVATAEKTSTKTGEPVRSRSARSSPGKEPANATKANATSAPTPSSGPATAAATAATAAANQEGGFLSLRVNPWGEVSIDGVRIGETGALVKHPLAAGTHQVLVHNGPLGRDQKLEVKIEPGAIAVRKVDLTVPDDVNK